MAYLTVNQYRLKTLLPTNILDEIEARTPGWTAEQLSLVSDRVYTQLGKRYGQWTDPTKYPTILGEWVTHIVDVRALLKRGVSPEDQQYQTYRELHDTAWREVKEAADSATGLFDLSLEQGGATTGIARGGPLAYSESSPYVAFDQQGELGHREDTNRGGTSIR